VPEALPTLRDRGDFWGLGGWVPSKIEPLVPVSDDSTQLDKPVEVGSVIEHLPNCAITQRELDAQQLTMLA